MNRHEFEVHYSEAQIRRSTWAYVRMTLARLDDPDAIYLKAGKGAMIKLPIEGVDARALQFIRERIAAHRQKP